MGLEWMGGEGMELGFLGGTSGFSGGLGWVVIVCHGEQIPQPSGVL